MTLCTLDLGVRVVEDCGNDFGINMHGIELHHFENMQAYYCPFYFTLCFASSSKDNVERFHGGQISGSRAITYAGVFGEMAQRTARP